MRQNDRRLAVAAIASLVVVGLAAGPSAGAPAQRPHDVSGSTVARPCSANLTHWVTQARAQGLDAEAANVVAHLRVLDCRRATTASGGPSCTSP